MIVVVTGASSGIGAATARRLAREPGARLVLVARREGRLRELAAELGNAEVVVCDLTAPDAPAQVREHLLAHHGGRLDVLVNNAGAAWRGTFAEVGYAAVRQTMDLNFDAQVRLTEALLPLLRASAPATIVNLTSTAARVTRAGSAAYSASKAALQAWSDGLHLEERAHGVHVASVLPGFVLTEGFPQTFLTRRPLVRRLVARPETVADAIADAVLHGRSERYTPRPYAVAGVLRALVPGLVRRALS